MFVESGTQYGIGPFKTRLSACGKEVTRVEVVGLYEV